MVDLAAVTMPILTRAWPNAFGNFVSGPVFYFGTKLINNSATGPTQLVIYDGKDANGQVIDYVQALANSADNSLRGSTAVYCRAGLYVVSFGAGTPAFVVYATPVTDMVHFGSDLFNDIYLQNSI